jgi:hypothetical protein
MQLSEGAAGSAPTFFEGKVLLEVIQPTAADSYLTGCGTLLKARGRRIVDHCLSLLHLSSFGIRGATAFATSRARSEPGWFSFSIVNHSSGLSALLRRPAHSPRAPTAYPPNTSSSTERTWRCSPGLPIQAGRDTKG